MKRCQQCHTTITGRAGQRFCSDRCRNHYHNAERAQGLAVLREVRAKAQTTNLNNRDPGEEIGEGDGLGKAV